MDYCSGLVDLSALYLQEKQVTMSKYEKRRAKASVRWAYRAIDRALEHIRKLIEQFEPTHPSHAEFLKSASLTLLMGQRQLGEFYRITWGSYPADWYQDV